MYHIAICIEYFPHSALISKQHPQLVLLLITTKPPPRSRYLKKKKKYSFIIWGAIPTLPTILILCLYACAIIYIICTRILSLSISHFFSSPSSVYNLLQQHIMYLSQFIYYYMPFYQLSLSVQSNATGAVVCSNIFLSPSPCLTITLSLS